MGASVGITIALACQRRPPTRSVAFGRPISYRLSDIRLLALSWTLPSLSKTDRAPIVDKIVGLDSSYSPAGKPPETAVDC